MCIGLVYVEMFGFAVREFRHYRSLEVFVYEGDGLVASRLDLSF